jgi:hypothetical protein
MSGTVSDEAKKIFAKIKEKPELATAIAARELPNRTTLHKVYATTPGGARRLLFFCRHAPTALAESPQVPERWVLVFYRNKGDPVGDNMSHKNATFESQHERIEGKPQREKRTIYSLCSGSRNITYRLENRIRNSPIDGGVMLRIHTWHTKATHIKRVHSRQFKLLAYRRWCGPMRPLRRRLRVVG